MALHTERCVACRRDSPRITADEIADLHPQIPEWLVSEDEGTKTLKKGFKFRDFAGALEFARSVGELAEREGHHPRIVLEWGNVTLQWWTHAIKGLHRNDFIMAAKTDGLYEG